MFDITKKYGYWKYNLKYTSKKARAELSTSGKMILCRSHELEEEELNSLKLELR